MDHDFRFENTSPEISDEEIIEDLRRVATRLGVASLTKRQYLLEGTYSATVAIDRFGSWNAAAAKAGLPVPHRRNLSVEELFDNLREVWIHLGRQPRKREMVRPHSRFTTDPYLRHFGGWLQSVKAFIRAMDEQTVSIEPSVPERSTVVRGPRDPSLRLRFVVMRRDGFRCRVCGRSPAIQPGVELHVDHIVPWHNGGATTVENLQTLCAGCNLGKGTLTATVEAG